MRGNALERHGPLNSLPPVSAFEKWGIDIIGRLPITKQKNKWIITPIDYAKKISYRKGLTQEATTLEIRKIIYEEILSRFGCPIEVITDRGANFSANVLEEYFKECKIEHLLREYLLSYRFDNAFITMSSKENPL